MWEIQGHKRATGASNVRRAERKITCRALLRNRPSLQMGGFGRQDRAKLGAEDENTPRRTGTNAKKTSRYGCVEPKAERGSYETPPKRAPPARRGKKGATAPHLLILRTGELVF